MLEHLFGSKTRLKLLRIFFRDPEQAFFVRQLSRMIDVQINAVRREIELLLELGIIKETNHKAPDSHESGATLRKYFQAHTECVVYQELLALLLKEQVMGEEQFIKDIEGRVGPLRLLLLSGRFTQDSKAPTDLLLVGDLKQRSLVKLIQEYELEFGFEIRYTAMTEQEFIERRYVMDKFIFSLFESRHIKAVNKMDL
ncbi:MAG: hypothetical protein HYY51_03050 [Candidatus Magasanikbacteria bacterium]|nr:hypothetical protein [Candidatus Magasanikbacteria bacterium]